jgi:hypothetical protein
VCADQAHSSVERAGLLGGVKLRLLPADEKLRLRGETLERAIQEDRRNGLIPFYVSTILFDSVRERMTIVPPGFHGQSYQRPARFASEESRDGQARCKFYVFFASSVPLPLSSRFYSGVKGL